jgi:hypothetical protein
VVVEALLVDYLLDGMPYLVLIDIGKPTLSWFSCLEPAESIRLSE